MMELELYGIDIHANKLTFEEFCSKVNFFVPDHYKDYIVKFNFDRAFIVDDNILDSIGYEGNFHNKNQSFKKLLNDAKQKNENDKSIIPHNVIIIESMNYVEITFFNFIIAIMKMRTAKANEIRIFLINFMYTKERYAQYSLLKQQNDHGEEISKLQVSNEVELMKHKMIIMQNEHEIKLLRNAQELLQKDKELLKRDKEYEIKLLQKDKELLQNKKDYEIKSLQSEKEMAILQRDMDIIQKSSKINLLTKNIGNLEQNIDYLLPNTVRPPSATDKRQRFCLIDDGNNTEGRVFRRQCYSFEKAKQDYLLTHENGVILLEIRYSSNAMYFFNNIREYVKKELKDKILIVNNTVKVISPDYNLNMFVQDLLDKFSEEFKHHDYIIQTN